MDDIEPGNKLLNRKEAAEYLRTTESALASWASHKRYSLPFIKIGGLVRYKLSDLEDFIARHTIRPGKKEN